eukprot:JP446108.1.p1 GENE.JP446108.1~~JP446108.1.p1  ORF type:complete len:187 (-),score=15.43 JP446108.1:43-603(-)
MCCNAAGYNAFGPFQHMEAEIDNPRFRRVHATDSHHGSPWYSDVKVFTGANVSWYARIATFVKFRNTRGTTVSGAMVQWICEVISRPAHAASVAFPLLKWSRRGKVAPGPWFDIVEMSVIERPVHICDMYPKQSSHYDIDSWRAERFFVNLHSDIDIAEFEDDDEATFWADNANAVADDVRGGVLQ